VPPRGDRRIRLIQLHGQETGALQKLVRIAIALLLIDPFRRHGGAFGRRFFIGFGAQLIESCLDAGKLRRQMIDRCVDLGGQRRELLVQCVKIGRGEGAALQARFDLIQDGMNMIELRPYVG